MLRGDNALAEIARMIAIESLGQRFRERRLLGVLDDHRSPGNRLERHPVSANRHADGANDCRATNQPEHGTELTAVTDVINTAASTTTLF